MCHLHICSVIVKKPKWDPKKQFKACRNRTKGKILTPTSFLNVSSMKYALNMSDIKFMKECSLNKRCILRVLLCYHGKQLESKWSHSFKRDEIKKTEEMWKYLRSVRHTPMNFSLETYNAIH
ncbi:unnamed protein product [Heterobilharzia americana]|nr:unnamed protein product [Heterobilharzia americana]